MRIEYSICVSLLLLSSCGKQTAQDDALVDNVTVANQFIDAFYSFDSDSLQAALADAQASQPGILYYQKWAECGNYEVVERDNFVEQNDSTVVFPVTVRDDLIGALHIDFNVTDTFHISFQRGKIIAVQTSSNDPEKYYEAKKWVKQNRPEYVEKACEGIWEGGPTPCECVQGMVKGFAEFYAKEAN